MPEMSPPLDFEPESESSPTSLTKSSPLSARARAPSILALSRASSARNVQDLLAALRGHRHIDEKLADRHGARRHELLRVGSVVLAQLLVGERHARHDFLALNGLEQEAALELLAKLLQREAFLLQRLHQPGVVELVVLL